jgi:hypothetical protein
MAARSMTTMSARLATTFAVALVLPWLEAAEGTPWFWPPIGGDDPYCLTWRVMVEANNAKGWSAVPAQCVGYVRGYMASGQYYRDVGAVAEAAAAYAAQVAPPAGGDGRDAWVVDVDDTCLSNQPYYQVKQFGYVRSIDRGRALHLHASIYETKRKQAKVIAVVWLTELALVVHGMQGV